MAGMPRTLTVFALANGAVVLATAIVFAMGDYGAFRPQDTGGFQQIAGMLVAYAAVAFVAFVVAARRRRWDLVGMLAVVIALGNAVFLFSPFYVPHNWHVAAIAVSAFVTLAAASNEPPAIRGLPAWLIVLGSIIGGVALIGAGRYEPGPNSSELVRVLQLAIATAGLVTFAAGAVLVGVAPSGASRRARER